MGEGRKKRLVAYFTDGTGTIELVWFRSMPYIRQRYIPGQWYLVFGKPIFFNGTYSISHPEIDEESKAAQVSGGLMPVYPLTEKLTRAGLNSRQMRQLLYVLKEACVTPHHRRRSPPRSSSGHASCPTPRRSSRSTSP